MVVRMGRVLDATLVRRASYAWVRSGSPRAFSRVQGREQDSTVMYVTRISWCGPLLGGWARTADPKQPYATGWR